MTDLIDITNEYEKTLKRMKKDFSRIYRMYNDPCEILDKCVYCIEQNIKDIKNINEKFIENKKNLEYDIIGLEKKIEIYSIVGDDISLLRNSLDIKKNFLEKYNEIEVENSNIINYFDSTVKDLKDKISSREFKEALSSLKNMYEVFKNEQYQ